MCIEASEVQEDAESNGGMRGSPARRIPWIEENIVGSLPIANQNCPLLDLTRVHFVFTLLFSKSATHL